MKWKNEFVARWGFVIFLAAFLVIFSMNLTSVRATGLPRYAMSDTVTFSDVPSTYWAWSQIELIYQFGVTSGCSTSPMMYCPEGSVTRAQLSIFLLRSIHGRYYVPPTASGTMFKDVPLTYWASAWVEQLAREGIASGCGNENFCPDAVVTRDQMAIFLLRGMHGAGYIPPTATGTRFLDVPSNYWAAAWIEQLVTEGITTGCGDLLYCPTGTVTRAQMAVFLANSLLAPYIPTPTFTVTPTNTSTPTFTVTPTVTKTPSPTPPCTDGC